VAMGGEWNWVGIIPVTRGLSNSGVKPSVSTTKNLAVLRLLYRGKIKRSWYF
jgi:hypothetical protein